MPIWAVLTSAGGLALAILFVTHLTLTSSIRASCAHMFPAGCSLPANVRVGHDIHQPYLEQLANFACRIPSRSILVPWGPARGWQVTPTARHDGALDPGGTTRCSRRLVWLGAVCRARGASRCNSVRAEGVRCSSEPDLRASDVGFSRLIRAIEAPCARPDPLRRLAAPVLIITGADRLVESGPSHSSCWPSNSSYDLVRDHPMEPITPIVDVQ